MGGEALHILVPTGGHRRGAAVDAVRASGLPELVEKELGGPFGHSSAGLALLEGLVEAFDVGLAAADHLIGAVLSSEDAAATDTHGSQNPFRSPQLSESQRRLVNAFQIIVLADVTRLRLGAGEEPEGALELDGLSELLDTSGGPVATGQRVLRLGRAYAALEVRRASPIDAERHAGDALMAFMALLRAAVLALADDGPLRPLIGALGRLDVRVDGVPYDGLVARPKVEPSSGLLPVQPDHIVGNADYLEAGLRLSRAVAGYDFELRRNPKTINPVLFGLGRPGCGKTVTAHAIGNAFLGYCRQRNVPARFVVVRRTDWASSYQNASALNLVRFFQEQVYAFEGVCGVYWPDIDTAFASRSSSGLRSEEKQNLGAVFGIFDGTLLPKDGKWFLICDANTLHMDEATISRIALNPFTVHGPKSPSEYARLMRDIMLRDVLDFVPSAPEVWERLGAAAERLNLSGRNIEAICANVRAEIQDFEYPDEYFGADLARRQTLIRELSRPVDEAEIHKAMQDWASFQREAEERAEAERFESEVAGLVRQLNAGRAAAAQQYQPPQEAD